jgi:hypothetical protein
MSSLSQGITLQHMSEKLKIILSNTAEINAQFNKMDQYPKTFSEFINKKKSDQRPGSPQITNVPKGHFPQE